MDILTGSYLAGTFRHAVDGKNRIFIPSKHRELLGESFMITMGLNNCLVVYSMAEWELLSHKLQSLPASSQGTVKRFLYSFATEVTPDSQGRVILTSDLMEGAEIIKNTVILGVGDHAEIWAEEKYNEYTSNLDKEAIMDAMISIGF